jgi:hypothetical protein
MLAAWYERPGPAAEVLEVGEMAEPEPSDGEVRVRVALSGVNPGDAKKRGDWVGSGLPFPRIVPHSDGAGVIDAVGQGVDRSRIGQRVWVYGAQSYRPFGTAAERTVVPAEHAVDLPVRSATRSVHASGSPGSPRTPSDLRRRPRHWQDDPGARGARRRRLARRATRALERRHPSSAPWCTRATSIRSTPPSRTL